MKGREGNVLMIQEDGMCGWLEGMIPFLFCSAGAAHRRYFGCVKSENGVRRYGFMVGT